MWPWYGRGVVTPWGGHTVAQWPCHTHGHATAMSLPRQHRVMAARRGCGAGAPLWPWLQVPQCDHGVAKGTVTRPWRGHRGSPQGGPSVAEGNHVTAEWPRPGYGMCHCHTTAVTWVQKPRQGHLMVTGATRTTSLLWGPSFCHQGHRVVPGLMAQPRAPCRAHTVDTGWGVPGGVGGYQGAMGGLRVARGVWDMRWL